MIRVMASSVIDAPVETVWEILRDFGALGEWLPGVAACALEEGGASDRIGTVRRLDMGKSGIMREQLLGLSDAEHAVTFSIVETELPMRGYRSTIRLLPITDGGGSYVSWTGEFEAAPEDAGGLRESLPRDVYQSGFDSLKRRFAASPLRTGPA